MDNNKLDELKDGLEGLVKNVKTEDVEKLKDLVKDGLENVDEIKDKVEAVTDKLPDELKDQLGKLEGLKNLFGGHKE